MQHRRGMRGAKAWRAILCSAGLALALAANGSAQTTDADNDGLPDAWETQFGLNTNFNSAAGDPDFDGIPNLAEYQAGSHPRGVRSYYFAEGVQNAFFTTRLAIANPVRQADPLARDARVLVTFLTDADPVAPVFLVVPRDGRRSIVANAVAGLPGRSFGVVIESDYPVAAERTVTWGGVSAAGHGYGSHTERSMEGPNTTWFLAEGSTSGDFSLFYLLQNSGATATTATVRYLRPGGLAPIVRTYALPARSRTTIPVDSQQPELAGTDVSAVITAPLPIIVERSMYKDVAGQPFGAGHASAGVTAPSTTWFLAEGATGAFFDTFILVANPGSIPAQVRVDYLLASGATLSKDYLVPAESRFTIWVDDEAIPGVATPKPLANTEVSSRVTSSQPVIVERTMWWPGPQTSPSRFWTEAHNSPGTIANTYYWVLAEGEYGGPDGVGTYVLLANTGDAAVTANIRVSFDGATAAVIQQPVTVAAHSRRTVDLATLFPGFRLPDQHFHFGVFVEGNGPLVVERALYASAGGELWASGTNAVGTPTELALCLVDSDCGIYSRDVCGSSVGAPIQNCVWDELSPGVRRKDCRQVDTCPSPPGVLAPMARAYAEVP